MTLVYNSLIFLREMRVSISKEYGKQKYRHCLLIRPPPVRLWRHTTGVVNETDDDCKQQVPTGALSLQQLTTPPVWRRSARLTTAVIWHQVEQEVTVIFIFEHSFIWNQNRTYIHIGRLRKDLNAATESAMPTSYFLILFHSNYGSILVIS